MGIFFGLFLLAVSLVALVLAVWCYCDLGEFSFPFAVLSGYFLCLQCFGIYTIVEYKQKSWAVEIGIAEWETDEQQGRDLIKDIIFIPATSKIINTHKLKKAMQDEKDIKIEQDRLKTNITANDFDIEKKMKK